MYENPQLHQIGKAEEVILGIASIGYDFDGHMVTSEFIYADDELEARA